MNCRPRKVPLSGKHRPVALAKSARGLTWFTRFWRPVLRDWTRGLYRVPLSIQADLGIVWRCL